jgi:CarD family transcriptional regulator
MFREKEKVVYPGHGVAYINRILEKSFAGNSSCFYELKFVNKDMTILVPMHNANDIGLRPLSTGEKVTALFEILAQPARKIHAYELTASSWNKRHKEYQNKLRSGELLDITQIYRDLKQISFKKELSFGEKNLLNQTEAMLVEEIAAVEKLGEEQAVERLRSACLQVYRAAVQSQITELV